MRIDSRQNAPRLLHARTLRAVTDYANHNVAWALDVLAKYLDSLSALDTAASAMPASQSGLGESTYHEALGVANRQLETVRAILADVLPDVSFDKSLEYLGARSEQEEAVHRAIGKLLARQEMEQNWPVIKRLRSTLRNFIPGRGNQQKPSGR